MVAPIYNKLLVEVESEWKEQVEGKHGIVGVIFENTIDRKRGAQIKGKVVAVPRYAGFHHLISRVKEQVGVGDVVYFHFNSIDEDSRIELDINSKPLYTVGLESIHCIVREGCIIMYGGKILCEPVYDDDVLIEDGIRLKKSKTGIITDWNVTHNLKQAVIAHIGNPLADLPPVPVKPHDKIYYDKDSDNDHEIEGKKYFIMTQEDLLMQDI